MHRMLCRSVLFYRKQGLLRRPKQKEGLYCGETEKCGGARMKGHMNTQMGEVLIDTDVIAKYAGSVAVECFGIVGMASVNMKDGLVKLLKKDSLTHGISVELNDNRITLDFHVIVVYGVNISSVADNLISTVKYQVEEFTGMEIEKINIYVEGVRVID